MQEILSEVNALGFFPDNLIPDGKLRRFKRTPQDKHPDAWCRLFENHTTEGKPFHVYIGGDWREPGLEIKISSIKKLSQVDKKIIDVQIDETRKELEKERIKLQQQCIKECEHIWETAAEFSDTEYTLKKKISGNFSVKTKPLANGSLILVPLKTVAGNLVGMQKIYPNGKKFFHPGTAKKGSFHLIGENINGETYICEGFATGATIHMATGKPVVVAFDAGNLVPVAKEIRKIYHDTKITICGDDDRDTVNNPGRTMAEKAAKESLGIAVFPDFKEPKKELTDFNDLYVKEGLEKVKSILTNVTAEKHYLKPLGTHGEKFFYISAQGNRVTSLTSSGHNKNNLFSLMPLQYWETVYESKKGTRWDQAFSDLMSSCQQIGAFNPEKIRGVGVWEDKGRLLINMGHGLYHGGSVVGLNDIQTKYIYQAGPKIKPPVKNDLSVDECYEKLVATAALLNWKKEESRYLLLGFIALARFCGAMQWRPHLWITGGFGTGKSTIMERMVRPLLTDISLYFLGNTTEAGIRQSVGYDARPVIFDEFETNDKNTDIKIKATLDLMRQASSESDARIAKGSAAGSAIDYRATFCAIVSSIRVNLTNGADKSRFAVLELAKSENPDQWDQVKIQFDYFDNDFSERLFSRIFHMWPIIVENKNKFQRLIAVKHGQRVGQQYGTLLSGFAALTNDGVLSDIEATNYINLLDLSEKDNLAQETDETDCLNHLLETKVRLEIEGAFYEKSIGEFVLGSTNSEYRKAIRRIGLDHVADRLFVANNNAELSKIFKDTKWSSGWKNSLARIPGAEMSKGVHWFGTTAQRYVSTPFKAQGVFDVGTI